MEWLETGGRRFRITPYARRRMARRGITRDDVEAVVGNPLVVRASRASGLRYVCRRTLGGRRLVVVIEEAGKVAGTRIPHWVVVTTWEEGHDG